MVSCKYITPAKRCSKLINDFDRYRSFFCSRTSDFQQCEFLSNNQTVDRHNNVPIQIKRRR